MNSAELKAAIQRALACYAARDFAGAEAIYRQIIAVAPVSAHFSDLGVTLEAQGKVDDAVKAFQVAIAADVRDARPHHCLANLLRDTGKTREAEGHYRQAIALAPRSAEALNSLGWMLLEARQFEEAMDCFRKAIAANPRYDYAHNNMGVALYKSGRIEEAAGCYGKAIELNPANVQAHDNLGSAHAALGRFDQAIDCHRRAIQQNPRYATAHNNLGLALMKLDRLEEAVAQFGQAVQLNPRLADAHVNLGVACLRLDRIEDAIASCQTAVELDDTNASAHRNLANSYRRVFRIADALASYKRAMELSPDNAEYHWDYALVSLLSGDYPTGWREYEFRWLNNPKLGARKAGFIQPEWTGSDISGKTILLYVEQGYGDVIQFVRYAPLLSARGAKVIIAAPPEIVALLRACDGVSQAVTHGERLPSHDFQCAVLSLPFRFNTTLDTVPTNVPYIKPDQERAMAWKSRMPSASTLKVGLIWGGRVDHDWERSRACRLADFAPLAKVRNVQFYSLQLGEHADQATSPPAGMSLVDWTSELTDFTDTAALMANLDLVISVDTAGAHLAGALAKPVWLLNRHESDWRWMLDRQDSPWYPTMRIFRQTRRGEWHDVLEKVAAALAHRAEH